MGRLQIHTSGVNHADGIQKVWPGVPLYHVPVSKISDLQPGDHILYQVCRAPYRACYRSALVVTVEEADIYVVMNSSDGVKEEQLKYSKHLYKVNYSHCNYTNDEAIQRAKQRFSEKCYHCLYNNSHHFVTLAKTGRENPLTEIIESLTDHEGMLCQLLFPEQQKKFFCVNTSGAHKIEYPTTGTALL